MDLYGNHINLPVELGNGRASISLLPDVLASQSSFLSEYKMKKGY